MGTCSRCGRTGETEYGTDGQAYCSACLFYGMNKQCWRCRMYLPASELQQYQGQWTCPYCLMDMRDEDRRRNERAAEPASREKLPLEQLAYPERCERCGRDLEGRVYILNGKKLCKSCLDDEKGKWELVSGKPAGPGERIPVIPVGQRKKAGLLSAMVSDILYALRLKKRPAIKEIIVYDGRMQTRYAKPMAELPRQKSGEKKPKAEGLMQMRAKKRDMVPEKTILPAAPGGQKGKQKKPKKKGA